MWSLTATYTVMAQPYEYPFQNPDLPEEERIDNLISLMTIDEKIATIGAAGVPRLGIPTPGSTEAIHGIVRGGASGIPDRNRQGRDSQQNQRMVNSTAFPQGYGMGETWDRNIVELMGEVMSIEARYYSQKQSNCLVLWAPNADLARDPRWGRTEESFGEDPFLVGELVAAESRGIQGKDEKYWRGASLMKHFLANSNEDGRGHTDSRFDEALFRDYYSYGFWKGVTKGGARSLMCAYNKYNGVPCSANDFIKEILIDEWGMDGTIVNDGGALAQVVSEHHWADDIKEAARICMEAGISRFLDRVTDQIREAYDEGIISEDLIDRNIRFNLRTILRLGLMDSSDRNPYSDMQFDSIAPWETDRHMELARLAADESVVLLKNEGSLLPLDKSKIKRIAVFGNRADQVLKDWYGALPVHAVSALEGIRTAVDGYEVEVRYQQWDSDGMAQELARWADVCIVCVGNHPTTSPDWGSQSVQSPWGYGNVAADGREAVDRRSLQLETEDLIKVVWQANPNTVAVLISSFPYTINWTQENVPSILHITQCGQALGTALADVIFGDYNPAGRTNQTWVKDILDLPNMLDYDIRNGRTYMYFKGDPLYSFGHGLSYTTFRYSRLKVQMSDAGCTVSFDLENTGTRDGDEVPQLYIRFPGDDASMRLRGFERINLKSGEKKHVEIVVPAEDLKLWNTESHCFEKRAGRTRFMVGASSSDIRLKKSRRVKV